MADTLIEKILRRASGGRPIAPGDIAVCDVDMTVLLDLQFAAGHLADVITIPDSDKVAVVMDHAVPAPSIADAQAGKNARAFVAEHGIKRFFDIGRHGIVHQVMAEQGLARPGMVIACTDSHTCAAGALGAAARGLGPLEVLQIVCTGTTWYEVPPTLRYDLVGRKHAPVPVCRRIVVLAPVGCAYRVTMAIGAKGIELPVRRDVEPAVEHQVIVFRQRVAELELKPVKADFARVEDGGRGIEAQGEVRT